MVGRIMTVKIKREDAAERSGLLFAWNVNNAGVQLREDERHDGNRKNSETESDQREGLWNLSL